MDFTAPKTARTNGIEMEYFEQGEGTPVLLLQASPSTPSPGATRSTRSPRPASA